MPGFWYCLRDRQMEDIVREKRLVPGELRRAGLDVILSDVIDVPDHAIVSGPVTVSDATHADDVFGIVIYPKSLAGGDPTDWHYNPSQQTWQPYGDGRDAWIGWQTNAPPTPADLERRTGLAGLPIKDAADGQWVIPIARSNLGRDTLPATFRWTPDGAQRRVSAEYQRLWDLSGTVWDWHTGRLPATDSDQYLAAVEILQANYRLGPHELNALDDLGRPVLTTGNIAGVFGHFIDWGLTQEALDELQKKTGGDEPPPAAD